MATRMPRPTPAADATSPTRAASPTTDAMTWPRLAPRARSRPSSRVRWATRIEKVFRIMNAPTNSEMPANTSRKVLKNPRASLIWPDCSSATWVPVRAS